MQLAYDDALCRSGEEKADCALELYNPLRREAFLAILVLKRKLNRCYADSFGVHIFAAKARCRDTRVSDCPMRCQQWQERFQNSMKAPVFYVNKHVKKGAYSNPFGYHTRA